MAGKKQERPTEAANYLPGFPLCDGATRTPFSGSGEADAGALFLYLTHGSREQFTHLFAAEREQEAAAAALKAYSFLPDRQAAMWLLEVVHTAKPAKAEGGVLGEDCAAISFPPAGLKRREWPMRKHVVIADPDGVTRSGPRAHIVSYHDTREEAVSGAKSAAEEWGVAMVAALIREDWPWDAPPRKLPSQA